MILLSPSIGLKSSFHHFATIYNDQILNESFQVHNEILIKG